MIHRNKVDEARRRLWAEGWSAGVAGVTDSSGRLMWVVTGWKGEDFIRAEGATLAAAWESAYRQAMALTISGWSRVSPTMTPTRVWLTMMRSLVMHPGWNRQYTVSAEQATLLGVAVGCAVATLCAVVPLRDFSFATLESFVLGFGIGGGIIGYSLWIAGDPVRLERLRRITSLIVLPASLILTAVFWDFWLTVGPLVWVVCLLFVCAAFGLVVSTGLGVAHLVSHLTALSRRPNLSLVDPRSDALWDRDLDLG